ncbi:MAG: ATP-binding protein [Chromatiales bacterium]|jgi:hypothetical protein
MTETASEKALRKKTAPLPPRSDSPAQSDATRHLPLSRLLPLAVQVALLEFWHRALPAEASVCRLLEAKARAVSGADNPPAWQVCRQRLYRAIEAETDTPLAQLCRDFQLNAQATFLFALVGEVETCHETNMAIAALQAPDHNPRPSLHFVHAMLEALFDDAEGCEAGAGEGAGKALDIFAIVQHDLVQAGLLQVNGEVPTPLRTLSVPPALWAVLCGRQASWPHCIPLEKEIESNLKDAWLSQEMQHEVDTLVAMLDDGERNSNPSGVLVRGNPHSGRRAIAMAVAQRLSCQPLSISLDLWRDQPALSALCRYGNYLPVLQAEIAPGESLTLPRRYLQPPMAIIMSGEGSLAGGDFVEVNTSLPTVEERRALWRSMTGDVQLAAHLGPSALLSAAAIARVAAGAQRLAQREDTPLTIRHIHQARQKIGAEKLRLLAQPVFRTVNADALVIPALVAENLDTIILRAAKREALSQGLGRTLAVTSNPGVRVLFVGESGTGKTLAASFIATRLGAPLYRVDLSAVMNKYIGESEKNLAQLLDYAAASDVVLLFDEADALFGSRTEGKDTGERYANMLTNYLLTRIETHPGIVILTTNSSERIDDAFNRRIDAVVEFPLPGYQERLHLWRSHLGERGPGEDIYRNLASFCDLAGGQIRNAVLTAAVYAEGERITTANLWEGLRAEYNKLGRDMPRKLDYLANTCSAA